jgi:hypothetical protein
MASPLTVYSSADGFLMSENSSYALARASATYSFADINSVTVGQQIFAPSYYLSEAFLAFDTSEIAAGDEVTSAVLSLYGQLDGTTTNFVMEAYASDWGASLGLTDWVAGADLGGLTLLASYDMAGGWPTNQYTNLSSEDAFLDAIVKEGTTRIVLVSNRMRLGTAPSNDEQVGVWMHTKGSGYQPKLVVEYGAASPAATAFMQPCWPGVW